MSMFLKNHFKSMGREGLEFKDSEKYPAKHFLWGQISH